MVYSEASPTLVLRLIWEKARTNRLILVSKAALAAVVREVGLRLRLKRCV